MIAHSLELSGALGALLPPSMPSDPGDLILGTSVVYENARVLVALAAIAPPVDLIPPQPISQLPASQLENSIYDSLLK